MSNRNYPLPQLLFAMDMLPLDGEHFRNNNNQDTLWHLRDRLFHVLFERATVAYATTFPKCFRKFLEIVFLVSAVISLFTLAYIHMAFVQVPVNCLETETQTWSREGVLRVEISLEEPTTDSVDMSHYCNDMKQPPLRNPVIPSSDSSKTVETIENQMKLATANSELASDNGIENLELDAEKTPEFINRTLEFKDSVSDPDCLSPLRTMLSDMEMFTNTVWPQDEYIIEYSLEYGFLRLSTAARQNTSVKVLTVTLDPLKDKCFGNYLSQFVLKYVVGYGDVLMSSLKYLVDKDENKGFVRNVVTGENYRFVDKSTTWTAYFPAAFIMMVFTLSISMLLRYSHHQIFMFIVELLHVFEFNTSVSFPAAPLLTVVLALVGMEAIMSEFFNDSSTAFYVILIVWIADQYDTICCHTPVSKRHWLRFFYLYHFAFYAYHYRFNGQYSNLALATSWLFIQHSMLFFFHRYELPAVVRSNEPLLENGHNNSPQIENDSLPSDAGAATENQQEHSQSPLRSRTQSNQDNSSTSSAASTSTNNDSDSCTSGASLENGRKASSKKEETCLQACRPQLVS
ncbi:membralin-like [Uloborus diversus]|uniref:membralin-like n=1 Tax=Uloborus diversus TaxID=327109 RepID=UPI00240A14C3|nr:membralin-like [Uloborus diversus]